MKSKTKTEGENNDDGDSKDANAISFSITSIESRNTVPPTSSNTPISCSVPSPVQDDVDKKLKEDEKMGVISKVLSGPCKKRKAFRNKKKKKKMEVTAEDEFLALLAPTTPQVFISGTWVSKKTTLLDLSSVVIKKKTPAAAFAHHVFEGGD